MIYTQSQCSLPMQEVVPFCVRMESQGVEVVVADEDVMCLTFMHGKSWQYLFDL